MKFLVTKFGRDLIKRNKFNWKQYFDNLSSQNLTESYKVNGFLDSKLVSKIRYLVRKIIENNKFKTIYDCGCGDGSVTGKLVNNERKIIGIDFSSNMCKKAAEKGIKTIQLEIQELAKVSFANILNDKNAVESKENCLLFCESLGCLDNPIKVVEGILVKNKNLNAILLSFPNDNSIIRKIINLLHNNEINYFSLESLKKNLTQLSFNVYSEIYIIGIPFVYFFYLDIKIKNKLLFKIIKIFASNFGLNIVVLLKKNKNKIEV